MPDLIVDCPKHGDDVPIFGLWIRGASDYSHGEQEFFCSPCVADVLRMFMPKEAKVDKQAPHTKV